MHRGGKEKSDQPSGWDVCVWGRAGYERAFLCSGSLMATAKWDGVTDF